MDCNFKGNDKYLRQMTSTDAVIQCCYRLVAMIVVGVNDSGCNGSCS